MGLAWLLSKLCWAVQSAVACTQMQPIDLVKMTALHTCMGCMVRFAAMRARGGRFAADFAERAGIYGRSPKLPYTPQHHDRPLTDQPGAGYWPETGQAHAGRGLCFAAVRR